MGFWLARVSCTPALNFGDSVHRLQTHMTDLDMMLAAACVVGVRVACACEVHAVLRPAPAHI